MDLTSLRICFIEGDSIEEEDKGGIPKEAAHSEEIVEETMKKLRLNLSLLKFRRLSRICLKFFRLKLSRNQSLS